MRNVLSGALALLASCALFACGGSEPAAQPTSPMVVAGPANNGPLPLLDQDGGAIATPTPPADPPKQSFPPPRPVTISLVSSADDATDKELKAGDDAFEADDLKSADQHYQAAQKASPKRAAPIVGLARVKMAKENAPYDFGAAKGNAAITAAAKDLTKAAKMEPSLGAAQVELGRALLLLGDAKGEINSLKKGVALLPNEPEAHSTLGVAWLALGHPDEALAEMGQAAKLDPGNAARHGNYGTTLLMRGQTKEAIEEYKTAAAIDDKDARTHSDLGTALLGDNQVVAAIPELTKATTLDPDHATYHSNLGYALQIEGKMQQAEDEYRRAIKLDSKLASAWINLATLLAKDPKRRGEAKSALEQAKAIDPTDPRVKANLEELEQLK